MTTKETIESTPAEPIKAAEIVETLPSENKKEITKIDLFKQELNQKYAKAIQNYFNKDEEKTLKFFSSISYMIEKVPKLLECDKSSLFEAIIQCAQVDLFPGVGGEVWILPFKGKATFILGYPGLVTLLYQAGVDNIYGEIVREKDDFDINYGTNAGIFHKPFLNGDRGEAIGCYVVVENKGKKVWKYMTKDEIMKHKEKSPSKDSVTSPWKEENDPDLIQWLKTCLKRLGKFLPKNEKINRALEYDIEENMKDYVKRKMIEEGNKPSSNSISQLYNNEIQKDLPNEAEKGE